MRKISILLLLLAIAAGLQAQNDTVKYWKVKGKVGLNVNQNYFSNWAAGGENNFGIIGKYSMHLDYAKGKDAWLNWINMALGYSVIGDADPMKTDDKIEFISTYKRNISKYWSMTAVASFKSQFANGYDYAVDSSTAVSHFLAPAYIDFGPGFLYKPVKWFSVNISPANMHWVVVNDQRLADLGSFGLDPAVRDADGNIIAHAKKSRLDFGARMLIILKYEIAKNVTLATKLDLFSNYLDKPQNIVTDWQTDINMKVNSWLNVNFSTTVLYDDRVKIADADGNIGPRTQFKQLLMVGVGFNF
ncbi:DUF3078 domain-containing protein [Candidatus Sulfidibacterium hydrothermale]|uniref:DUF3078 domain-containing protein n=1 Tax=Candidatus Sulfidibacterium hydrothermale TaxID=2875962 RepID=UPI001F0A8CB7|nr:DUF3078 domain-containing protein [Candidatus Sulfidibacterium hydrothermale]UBM63489.1 DUF3078 domain-containing protein [Candidatus Sulfidibacterium hydrothermale]